MSIAKSASLSYESSVEVRLVIEFKKAKKKNCLDTSFLGALGVSSTK